MNLRFYRIVRFDWSVPSRLAEIARPRKNTAWRYNESLMIPQDLLEMLVCPVCKKPVVLVNSNTSLKCGECRRVYPIQDDIPIMLVDAAKVDAS